MANISLETLLSGVDQGQKRAEDVYSSLAPGIQSGVADLKGSAGQISESAKELEAVTRGHMAATAAGEASAATLATKQSELEQIILTETYNADKMFKPQYEQAVAAVDNVGGLQRIAQYQRKATETQAKLEQDIKKSNENPLGSLFDGTYQSLQTGRATQEQLAKGLSIEVTTQQLSQNRLQSMLSNEENMRKFTTEAKYQKSIEISTANLVHVKAVNRQKVTESDVEDMARIYGLDKDKTAALATALNAQMSLMSQGVDVARSLSQSQLVKMQIASAHQTYSTNEELTDHFQQIHDMGKSLNFDLPVAKMRHPELMNTEEQSLYLTLSNRFTFGTKENATDNYNATAIKAPYNRDAATRKLGMDDNWHSTLYNNIQDKIDLATNEADKLLLKEQQRKLKLVPETPNEMQEAFEFWSNLEKDVEKVDATDAIDAGLFALTSPVAVNADGSVVTFKDLSANGTLQLKNPDLMDTLGVDWNVNGEKAGKLFDAKFETIAASLESAAKRKDGFNLTEQTVMQVAEDLARIHKFQVATGASNPNFPLKPKTLAIKGIDLGNGESKFFGGYNKVPTTLDITNPQTMFVMLQNRLQRRMVEAANSARQQETVSSKFGSGAVTGLQPRGPGSTGAWK